MALLTAATDPRTDSESLRHPLLRATAVSSLIGLVAGLTLGAFTQAQERDQG